MTLSEKDSLFGAEASFYIKINYFVYITLSSLINSS